MEDIRPSLTGFIEVSVSRRKRKLDKSDLSDLIDLYNEIYYTKIKNYFIIIFLSAKAIVDGLCAIIIIVFLFIKDFNDSLTNCSDSLSRADVASSRRIIGASLIIARAIAIR